MIRARVIQFQSNNHLQLVKMQFIILAFGIFFLTWVLLKLLFISN